MKQRTIDYQKSPKYSEYKKRASLRFPNSEFITAEQFKEISSKNCHYCGVPGVN